MTDDTCGGGEDDCNNPFDAIPGGPLDAMFPLSNNGEDIDDDEQGGGVRGVEEVREKLEDKESVIYMYRKASIEPPEWLVKERNTLVWVLGGRDEL